MAQKGQVHFFPQLEMNLTALAPKLGTHTFGYARTHQPAYCKPAHFRRQALSSHSLGKRLMDESLLKRYREYASTEEAFAVLLVKKHLAQAKGHWVDVVDCRRYEMSSDNMHFRFVVGGLFKRKIHPKYPPRSDYTNNGRFNERAYYLMTRAITWETAHADIEQQKSRNVSPPRFEIRGVSYDKNAGIKSYFRDDAPPEIKALANNLQDRTSPLWDRALKYVNSPEFVYEVRRATVLPPGA